MVFWKKDYIERKKRTPFGDWGAYIDIQREIIQELQRVEREVKKLKEYADYTDEQLSHVRIPIPLGSRNINMGNREKREILRAVRTNTPLIMNYIRGGEDIEEGLIELITKEINDIEKFLQQNSALTPEVEVQLQRLCQTFNSKKARLYESLRNALGNEERLGLNLVGFTEVETRDITSKISKYYKQLIELINEDREEEDVMAKLLEISLILEQYRNVDHDNMIRQIGRREIKDFVKNYLERIRTPIAERVEKINEIIKDKRFIDLELQQKNEVYTFYGEIMERLFRGTGMENKVTQRRQVMQQAMQTTTQQPPPATP